MFDTVPALMTIAVECIEIVSTVARGRPTAPRLANFSVKAGLVLSGTNNGESSSIRSWRDATGVLDPPSSSIVVVCGTWGRHVLFMVAQDDWLRLVRDSHMVGSTSCPEALETHLTLTQDNAGQDLEEDLQGQVDIRWITAVSFCFIAFLLLRSSQSGHFW